jgi:uncharacterized protein with GYD domain
VATTADGERLPDGAVTRTVFRVDVEVQRMPKYASLINVSDREFQNAQELATLWGEISPEIEEHGGELLESYATLGAYDFIVIFEIDGQDDAFQVALSIERHGLDTQTMAIEDTENFAELVDDI